MIRAGHLCLAFTERRELADRARVFLDEGRRERWQLCYVTDRTVEEMRADLEGVSDLDVMVASGQLQLATLAEVLPTADLTDPAEHIGRYREATAHAVAAGYRGLRVVADVTALVRDRYAAADVVRYEHAADRLMATVPFEAICAYDAGVLDASTLEALACMHPGSLGCDVPFHVEALPDGWATLSGECDMATTQPLATVAAAVCSPAGLDIDLAERPFLDHRSILLMDAIASERGGRLRLRHATPTLRRLVETLDLRTVELVTA